MGRTVHTCISVRGMLNWDRRATKRSLRTITKQDGTRFASIDEFRNVLLNELVEGHEVLPIGNPCAGFDYKTGCPGHEEEEEGFGH